MVNPVCGELKEVVDSGLFSYIQFHGEEKPEILKGLTVKSIKAFSIEGGRDLNHIGDYPEVDYYLFDARTGQKRGGTGSSFDWDLLKGCSIDKPFILAGGLGPDNIVNALCKLRPAAVDLNSRVESEPGIKEHRFLRDTVMKIRRFERLLSLNEAKIRGNEDKLSGNEDKLSGNEDKLKGNEAKLRGNEAKLKGDEAKLKGNEAKLKGDEAKLRGGERMINKSGYFGEFGGSFVPETLVPALQELEEAYNYFKDDPEFNSELESLLKDYSGRPTPLYYAEKLTEKMNGASIYLKREDLNHTGAHKINNTLGQILLAVKMGKKRIIAETGAGQHGVATATAAARFGLECCVYMGEKDIQRQSLNVYRMNLLGAEVIPVKSGTRTLKDATNEAIRDWVSSVRNTHYIIGSVVGPHPYPTIVRDFQQVIGIETRKQIIEQENRLPDYIIACVGGGSNSIGIFYPFIQAQGVKLIGVEAGGEGIESGKHAASLNCGAVGVLHGSRSFLLQDEDGQIKHAHSISAGLDYPGIGPEHSYLYTSGKAEYLTVTDREAVQAFELLSREEGILPALESSHALALAFKLAPQLSAEKIMVINLSGRGDKDVNSVLEYKGDGQL